MILKRTVIRSVINKVDRILKTFQRKSHSGSSKNTNALFSYKSEENVTCQTEYNGEDISKQFNRDRINIELNLKKKALLSNVTVNFKDTLAKNFQIKKDFKCYEKPKKSFMNDVIKQAELINKIGTCKLTSGPQNFTETY